MTDEIKNQIAVVGAGFSGLTIAWALRRLGLNVCLYEAGNRTGGLISSHVISGQLVESAANALIADQNVEMLLNEIKLNPVTSGFKSNKRFIFRRRPSQLPLGFFELLRALAGFIIHLISGRLKPKPNENVSAWAKRVFGNAFDEYLVSPALQGIYVAPSRELSAELVLSAFFNKALRTPKANFRGSISFKNGMQELTDSLTEWLNLNGVRTYLNSHKRIEELQKNHDVVVLAVSLDQAKALLQNSKYSNLYSKLSAQDVMSVAVQPSKPRKIRGFGCLFPPAENFKSLGVLFNSDIFENRGHESSETWILPGQILDRNSLKHVIANDRVRLTSTDDEIEILKSFVWPKSLPKYDLNLKNFIFSKEFINSGNGVFESGACLSLNSKRIYLTGNYLGGIGLAKILSYNLRLADRIKAELV